MALPTTAVYAMLIWLVCGLFTQQWWMQFACFVLSTYLMVIVNNYHALIRIYSRMVSCSFLVLSCVACHLFPDLKGGFAQFCVVASYLLLFTCYQSKQSSGRMYYAFFFLGLASCTFVQMLFFVPLLWLLVTSHLNAMSWRTFLASLMGLVTPYWIAAPTLFLWKGNMDILTDQFAELINFQGFSEYSINTSTLLTLVLVVALGVTGIVHFVRTSHNDKIRIRQLYGIFIAMTVVSTLFMLLQPQHSHVLLRLLIINASPLIGHFFALTHTKWTNIAFYAIVVVCLIVTGINIWISSSIF